MRPILLITLAAMALANCSTARRLDAPTCHGARRPANPYGSILAPAADASSAPPAAAAASGCRARRP